MANIGTRGGGLNAVLRTASRLIQRELTKVVGRRSRDVDGPRSPRQAAPVTPEPAELPEYPGDFTGTPAIVYDPHPDGAADPGEIVWAWVPFEEDHSRGKDRPVLLIGHDDATPGGPWLLALQLTSKDHDRDDDQERRAGRRWVDIGSGDWDRQGRPSEVRINRVLRIHPDRIRREGAVLAEPVFDHVADAVRAHT